MYNYIHRKKNNNNLKTNIMIVGKNSVVKGFFLFLMALVAILVLVKLCVVGGVSNIILAVANMVLNAIAIVLLYKMWSK